MRTVALLVAFLLVIVAGGSSAANAFEFMGYSSNNNNGNIHNNLPALYNSNNKIGNGPAAPAQLQIHDSLFSNIAAAVVPIINQMASNISIPGQSSKHFDINTIHINNFNLGPITFAFIAPNKVQVTLSSLGFNIPNTGFKLKEKIAFVKIHCSGNAYATVLISATFSFNLIDTNGKLALDGSTAVNINYKTLNVGYKMHGVCKIVAKLISFVVGGITSKIKSAVEKNLGPGIEKALTASLSNAFARLPVGVTGNPSVSNGVLTVPVDLDSLIHAEGNQGLLAPPPLRRSPREVGSNVRDVQLICPQSSANTVLQTITNEGKFHFNHTTKKLTTSVFKSVIPAAYATCPDCHIKITVDIYRIAPAFSFTSNNMSLAANNVSLGFFAVNPNNTNIDIPLFVLNLDAHFSVGGFAVVTNSSFETIKFNLGVEKIQLGVLASSVGTITGISTINWLISFVANTVIGIFNANFDGVPIPATGFTLTDILIAVSSGSVAAGFDVSI